MHKGWNRIRWYLGTGNQTRQNAQRDIMNKVTKERTEYMSVYFSCSSLRFFFFTYTLFSMTPAHGDITREQSLGVYVRTVEASGWV